MNKVIALLLCFVLAFEQTGFAQLAPSGGVAGQLDIASHLSGLSNPLAQDKFRPLHLRYLGYEGSNFKLLLDKGDFFSRPAIKQSISLPSVIASPEQSEGRSNLLASAKILGGSANFCGGKNGDCSPSGEAAGFVAPLSAGLLAMTCDFFI
jgi:hypothetical protein